MIVPKVTHAFFLAACLGLTAQAHAQTPTPLARLEKVRSDLKSTQVEVRRAAIRSLVHSDLSAKLREEIQEALTDKDAEVRATAGTATGNLGAAAVPAIPALIALMQGDANKEARETAARALGRIGKAAKEERRAVAPLRQTAAKDADPVTRVVALGALAMMEVDVPGQVVALRKYLHANDALVRMKAAHALGMIGLAAKAAAPEIVTVLERATESHQRGYIARALGNTGDRASLPALYKSLRNETDPGARGEMQGAISRLGGKSLSRAERDQFERDRAWLDERLSKLASNVDDQADARIFLKGIQWALQYETNIGLKEAALVRTALTRAGQRVGALAAGKPRWSARRGKLVRGFVSSVDGSVQPYGLIVPARYDPTRATRLDVVLHGSSKPTGLSELRFLNRFDEGEGEGEGPAKNAPDQDFLELHPLGRVENGYRWAGETDVFEAIEAVARHYNVDRGRIVLRGMSMGASGTWHLGLKHPDRFVALGPYCGYVDTFHFSRTPLANFIKVGPLPVYQEKTLHMVDSVDYAANAGVVPAIACMGEKDVFFQAHVLMGQAMEKEGLKMVNLISPGTGHVIDPVTFKEQMRRINDIAENGLDRQSRRFRFVTWTLKYSHCRWVQVLGLEEHYRRAEFAARVAENGVVEVEAAKNITRFAILPPAWQGSQVRLRVEGADVSLPVSAGKTLKAVIGRREGKWVYLGDLDALSLSGKRPGVQGPIDDAFTAPFLCVRGTGKAWNPQVQAWSDASLKRFAYEWHRYFRGVPRVKDDKDVTEDDARKFNLILFGDPGSNTWIAKALPSLPIQWTPAALRLGARTYPAADHAPLLIQPSPFAGGRYVVLNSGHTFHEKELASLNYLLFPRLGDWAVLRIGAKTPTTRSDSLEESVVNTGFCNEQWGIPP